MDYLQTFSRIDGVRVSEPMVQAVVEPGEADYGWQSYVVIPHEGNGG